MTEDFSRSLERLRRARRVVALTGAGISAESGVPTFRGEGGLWRDYRAEDLATPDAFRRDPELVWEWYDWRRGLIAGCRPNRGHETLALWEGRFESCRVVTQNVDGLHRAAGSRGVICLHGDIWTVRCTGCGFETVDLTAPLPELPPRCRCGGLLRPGVVWFGEALPEKAFEAALEAVSRADVVLVAGTSGLVYPAAGLPAAARSAGTFLVEINLGRTPLSPLMDAILEGPSGQVLAELHDALET